MNNAVKIYDSDFVIGGLCGDYTYLSFTRSFRESGTAELRLPVDSVSLPLFRPDGYVSMPGGEMYRIMSVTRDLATGTATVKCAGLLSLLRGTVIPEEYTLTGDASALMYHLVRKASGNLPLPLSFGGTSEALSVSFASGRSVLYDDLVSLCRSGDCGMSLTLGDGKLVFAVLPLRDRTATGESPLTVSRRMGTMAPDRVTWDMSSYKNVAVVSGTETEDGGRYTVTVRADSINVGDFFPDSEYFDRQMSVNFTAPVRPYMKENADGLLELDTEAYLAAMYASGAAALGRCRPKLYLEGVLAEGTVSPGDLVRVSDPDSGVSGTATAESVTTKYSREGGWTTKTGLSCRLPAELLA